jgi:Uncharacterized protein conserved in bacteria
MFILSLTYVKPLGEIDKNLLGHRAYLDKYYNAKKFICSGRKNPRNGGIILCNASDQDEVKNIIKEDPFFINKVAEYEIIEFEPTKFAPGFDQFINLPDSNQQ